MKISIINGPNLNLLGTREPAVYGNHTFETYLQELKSLFPNIEIDYFQSNIEGEIISRIQRDGFNHDGIVLNAAAFTHTSIEIGDAVKAISTPVGEVHISNIYSRESFRHVSFIAPHAKGVISGFGLESYQLAILSLI